MPIIILKLYKIINKNIEIINKAQKILQFWDPILVNTFNILKIYSNYRPQYLIIILFSGAKSSNYLNRTALLKSIFDIGTNYQVK